VSPDVAQALGVTLEQLFNLTVTDQGTEVTETHRNLTLVRSIRRIDHVLAQDSNLVRLDGEIPDPVPDVAPATDTVTQAESALEDTRDASDAAAVNVASAQRAVDRAQRRLDAANAATPPVQADIDAARQALDQAQQSLQQAQDALDQAQTAQDNAQTAIDAAQPTATNGIRLDAGDFLPDQGEANKQGLFALEDADLFNLLVIPPYLLDGNVDPAVVTAGATYCEKRRGMLLVDPRADWDRPQDALDGKAGIGTTSKNAALFFPHVLEPDPLREFRDQVFAPSGVVAGVMARTDATRGVWKAPAGLEATLVGVSNLAVPLTDPENGQLNPVAINCLRIRPAVGPVVWGSRTLQGDDRLASEWKYVPVRRTALFIEESLFRGTQWVVFEPNDEPLWSQIRLNVTAFMQDLFRQGAFQGRTPNEAYLVKVDRETTTQSDINRGIVNIIVGFAPLKPAEFVFLRIQQLAGQLAA